MTVHNEAKKEDIAKTVLMLGDPMRAKMIAEKYLDDYKLVNSVRGMYAYTGFYKGNRITVMASGMGIPSIGIYSYELYKFYDVDNIIRVGSCGTYIKDLNLYDIVSYPEHAVDGNYYDVEVVNGKILKINGCSYVNLHIVSQTYSNDFII